MSGIVPPEDWAKAKKEFFALTKVKKPREKFKGAFETSYTGLSKSMKAVYDYGQPGYKKDPKTYHELLEKYKKAATEYIILLTKIIDDEKENTIKEWTVDWTAGKVDFKEFKNNLYRGSKMLKAKLENYTTQFNMAFTLYSQSLRELSKVEKLEQNFQVMLANGFKRFAATAQAIKATPTTEVWNREMDAGDGVRSLTTALGTYRAIEKALTENPLGMTQEQTQMAQKTARWFPLLASWSNGEKKRLDGNLDRDAILNELKAASTVVKQCAADFGVNM